MKMMCFVKYFFFNYTATTEFYTLSLHDALPIFELQLCADLDFFAHPDTLTGTRVPAAYCHPWPTKPESWPASCAATDRKSTRLNSSHMSISYAVFCLKKKKKLSLY